MSLNPRTYHYIMCMYYKVYYTLYSVCTLYIYIYVPSLMFWMLCNSVQSLH